jgi:hypothetical protein
VDVAALEAERGRVLGIERLVLESVCFRFAVGGGLGWVVKIAKRLKSEFWTDWTRMWRTALMFSEQGNDDGSLADRSGLVCPARPLSPSLTRSRQVLTATQLQNARLPLLPGPYDSSRVDIRLRPTHTRRVQTARPGVPFRSWRDT